MVWDKGQEERAGYVKEWMEAWDYMRGLAALEGWVLTACPRVTTTNSESLYQLLSQTSPENMHRNVAQYGLDPATRYPNLNLRAVTPKQVRLSTPAPPAHLSMPGLPYSVVVPVGSVLPQAGSSPRAGGGVGS